MGPGIWGLNTGDLYSSPRASLYQPRELNKVINCSEPLKYKFPPYIPNRNFVRIKGNKVGKTLGNLYNGIVNIKIF